MTDEKKKSIGGLWINEGKNGRKYMAGSINGQKIIVFKNDFKQAGDKQPDYKIFESKPVEGFTRATAEEVSNILDNAQRPLPSFDVDDDIPFG